MKKELRRLGDLVGESLKRLNLEHKTREQAAVSLWAEVVGARVARAATAERIRDGILFVGCRSATWANELTFLKAEIAAKLNGALGGQYVKDIRFFARSQRTGRTPDQAEEPQRMSEKELEDIRLCSEEERRIDAAALASGSEELAAHIRKAFATSRKIEEWKRAHGWKKCGSCGLLFEDVNKTCPVCSK